jgi:hypothetical protein
MKTLSGIPMGEALAAPEQAKPAEVSNIRDRRRSSEDRRVGERRQEDRDHKRKRLTLMRSGFMLLGGLVLILTTAKLVSAYNNHLDALGPKSPMIQVRIPGAGVWKTKPKDMAYYFASQDVMSNLEKRSLPEKIRNDQLSLRIQNLEDPKNKDFLLSKVREMPWTAYQQRAEFSAEGKAEKKPTESDWQLALRDAVLE